MTGDMMMEIESTWKDMSIERLCTIVNDCSRLMEIYEENNDAMADRWSDSEKEQGEELLAVTTQLSLLATKYLCERMMLDVKDDYLLHVGGSEWHQPKKESSGNIVDTTLATLRDYNTDLQDWIPSDYYFPKLLKHSFDQTLQQYVGAFFCNTLSRGIAKLDECVETLHDDWMKMWTYFGNDEEMVQYHGKAGNHTKEAIWKRLLILPAIASLLSRELGPSDLWEDTLTIVTEFGVDTGATATQHLMGLRQERMNEQKIQEWHTMICSTTKHAEIQGLLCPSSLYLLPDLRNSRHVHPHCRRRRQLYTASLKNLWTGSLCALRNQRIQLEKELWNEPTVDEPLLI
eukprot:CAMPEP_0116565260 /NCGR_PEP_ID=MMETSP0397-20121206/13799_1 /TAXON_ID=216820 /ORGANISM="Cyclophora tenuis, Strain ECT3854" /LENGTH=344 /DNA_ID=CAMNT_0004092013 /DNA_START=23 /DNA_END=1057 /DNA_ORIENTATION=+